MLNRNRESSVTYPRGRSSSAAAAPRDRAAVRRSPKRSPRKPPAALPAARHSTGTRPGRSGSSGEKEPPPSIERRATTRNRHTRGRRSPFGREMDRGAFEDASASFPITRPAPVRIRSRGMAQPQRRSRGPPAVPRYSPTAPGDTNTPRGAALSLSFSTSRPPPTWNIPFPTPQRTAASRGESVSKKLIATRPQPTAAKGRFRFSRSASSPRGSCSAKAQAL